jgi:hypothetical protein
MCPSKTKFGYPFESDEHYEQHREAFNQSYVAHDRLWRANEDDQKVVNFEQILFPNGRTLHSTEAPAQRARAFSLTF